jgi:hypothetical protein
MVVVVLLHGAVEDPLGIDLLHNISTIDRVLNRDGDHPHNNMIHEDHPPEQTHFPSRTRMKHTITAVPLPHGATINVPPSTHDNDPHAIQEKKTSMTCSTPISRN